MEEKKYDERQLLDLLKNHKFNKKDKEIQEEMVHIFPRSGWLKDRLSKIQGYQDKRYGRYFMNGLWNFLLEEWKRAKKNGSNTGPGRFKKWL